MLAGTTIVFFTGLCLPLLPVFVMYRLTHDGADPGAWAASRSGCPGGQMRLRLN